MGFRVRVENETPSTEPGMAALLAFVIDNEDSANATLEISIEGLDPEWVAVPVPVVQLDGKGKADERIFLKPPRESESLSGTYPFVLNVRSSHGELKQVPLSLVVRPYHNVSIDVQPRRGMLSPLSRTCTFHATVMNLGNVEQTLLLEANDVDDLFIFEFETETVTVSPGAHKSVAVTVTPKKPALMANARLQQFTVSCRSTENKSIASASHGQIEQRSLITPSLLGLAALLVLVLVAFINFFPKRPVLNSLTITPEHIFVGQQVTIRWTSSNARSIRLEVGGQIFSDLDPQGNQTFTVTEEGEVTVTAWPQFGKRGGFEKSKIFFARKPEPVPDPVIEEFKIEPAELTVGQTFQVSYKLSPSVTDATLSPIGIKLDPKSDGVQLAAQIVGEFDYKLIASNSAGQTTEKSIHIKVVQGSKASIVAFRAEPAVIDPIDGRVALTWQVNNALRIELTYDGTTIRFDEVSGVRDFTINKDTTFKLIAYDEFGVTTDKEVFVRMKTMNDFITGGG